MSFLNEAADRHRLPVALLCGFLGSGKTTLLNRLLHDPRLADTAVAINEFGEVPLDQHLIDHGEDKTVVMANGCLCCNLAGDMEDALMRVFSRRASGAIPTLARLIVEPSGLADPAPIAQAILRNPLMSRVLRLDTTLATVDAVFGARQLDEHPEARKQAAFADRILLTKTDLAEPRAVADLRARLCGLNATAPILEVRHGAIDSEHLFAGQFFDPVHATPAIAEWITEHAGGRHPTEGGHAGHHHDDDTEALSIVCEAPLRWPAFEPWFRTTRLSHADDILRVKGILNIAGSRRPLVVHGVHHVLHPPVELERWPSDDHRSRLVFITRGRARDLIGGSWAAARQSIISSPTGNQESTDARH